VLHKDWPKYEEEDAVPYTEDELRRLFAAADEDQHIRCQFFLKTGARDKEVAFSTWQDIDFESKLFSITPKKDLGFKLKNHETRRVPLPDDLIHMLRDRRPSDLNARLVFPNRGGNPERKFLRKLKELALRAGLNCGHCTTLSKGNSLSCKDRPICKKWILHRFRKSFATLHHEAGVSPRTLQNWLGHKSLETTIRYLGIADARSKQIRSQVNKTFEGLAIKLKTVG
jgi:integrase